MSDSFWQGFWTAAPIIFAAWLLHKRQMWSIADNTEKTEASRIAAVTSVKVVTETADKIKETADKVDSATRNQASTAQAAASIAKVAAKDAKETAMDAKITAGTTTTAIENLSVDVRQLKEFVNGYLTQRLQEASKSGYAMGVSDQIGKTVEEHGHRIANVETKLGEVDSKVGTILELVRANNGERTQVRGESR